jgi:apolipoprotein N-acyltransferase
MSRREIALLGLAGLTGPLWFLAAPRFDLWPLAWVANVPLLFAIEGAATARRAVLYAWLAGTITSIGGFYWVSKLLVRFASFPLVAAAGVVTLLAAYHGLVFVLFAWAVRRIRARGPVPMALLGGVVFSAAEFILPVMFPFHLALTQAWQTPVIQMADLTGPIGVTALLAMTSGAIYDLAHRRWKPAAIAAAIVGCAIVYGKVRIGQMDAAAAAAPKLEIGMVQGNIPFDEKGFENPQRAEGQLHQLQDISAQLEKQGAKLIVWSETAFPFFIPRDAMNEIRVNGVRTRREGDIVRTVFRAPLIFGAMTVEVDDHGAMLRDRDPYNSAIYMDAEGKFAGRYDKNYLVLFSEELPLVGMFPSLRKVFPRAAGQLGRGQEIVAFPLPVAGEDKRLVPLVCFEDILPRFGRRAAALRPHLLVNVTNDAWFGDTSEPWEHLGLAVFRSVELRTWMVRAVNSGPSSFVDAAGRLVKHSGVIDPAEVRAPAEGTLGTIALQEGGGTIYAAVGDVFGWGCVAGTLFLLFFYKRPPKPAARSGGGATRDRHRRSK